MRRKPTVLVTAALCLGTAILYLCFATRIYTSTSRLYVEQNGPSLLARDPQNALDRSEAYLFRQCQVIGADTILRQAIDNDPADVDVMYRGVADPLPQIVKNLTVDLGKKDEIISIELNSPYPVQSARFVNSIVKCYQAFESQQTQSTAAEALKILQREKDKQEQLLDQRLREIVDFKQKNGEMFFTNDKGMNILMQNLATISEQLTKARLTAITVRVEAAHQNNRAQANQECQEYDQQVAEFERAFESEKQKALQINSAQAEFQKMQAEADRTTKLCDLLDARIKELNVTEDGGSMNIQVLDFAKPEDHPTTPKKSMTLLAALAAGMVLGSGLAVARERLDQRIRNAEEAGRLLGLPVLGAIPEAREGEPTDRRRLGCAVYLAPCSALADAHQSLGMAVHVGWPDDDAKTLLVTSPNRGDGKSTTCSNLAIAMARAGRKTLLIDGDLRRPVQHEIFSLPNSVGLADVLSRGMRVEHAIQTLHIDGLSLLPCGELPANPAELTSGPAFARMLERLEEQYDLIIIDSPPILAAPDARILGSQVDVSMLVLRAGSCTREEADHAARRLSGVGASVLGIVVNGVAPSRASSYYQGEAIAAPRERSIPGKRDAGNLLAQRDSGNDLTLTY